MSVLAIDAGTTGVTAVVVTAEGRIAAKGYQEFAQHFPQPGWVEHAPEEIWQATLEATREALGQVDADELEAIGITNQRETSCSGTARRSGSPRRAIVWQDRRTADICTRLRDEGHEDRVTELTGLRLDPYFSGTKLMWLRRARAAHLGAGRVGPLRRRHRRLLPDRPDDPRAPGTSPTSPTPAARCSSTSPRATGPTSCASCSACRATRCPTWCPTGARSATTDPTSFLGLALPIAGIAGDQQSALFGQTCFDEGDSKCTYGTGSFILTNTGTVARSAPTPGCSRPPPGAPPTATLTYALEGAIFVTGAAVQWLRDGLQIVGSAAETEAIAATVDRHRGRGLRARAHRPRRPALGPARPRPDHRHHPRHHPRPHRPGDARGDRLRGARRPGDDAGDARPRCGSTAARPPTTCSARSRPTRSAYPSSGRRSSRPPRWARRSSPASAPACGSPPTTCARPGQLDRRFEPGRRPRRRPTPRTPAGATPSSAPRAGLPTEPAPARASRGGDRAPLVAARRGVSSASARASSASASSSSISS